MGYVRVGQSLKHLDSESERLLNGLALGVVVSVICSSVGIFWLTRQTLKPIEQAFLELKRFTDDASHELKSPLMAMHGNLEFVLKRANLEPEHRTKLLIVEQAINDIAALADDLLFLARAGVHETGEPRQVIDLNSIITEVVDNFSSSAEEKKIELQFAPLERLFVSGRSDDLRKLFGNIISNAILYTPVGGKVTTTTEHNDGEVTVKVEDTGIGIADRDLTRIFDRFWRADRARSYRSGGSGLGLAIAKTIAKQHNGKIAVSSVIGKGSCFTISLPATDKA